MTFRTLAPPLYKEVTSVAKGRTKIYRKNREKKQGELGDTLPKIMKDAGLIEDDWIQTRLDQLNLIDEKRLTAVCHGQTYQKRMIKAFNKKFRRQVYQVGDLVIKQIILPQSDPRGKWTPNYDGPFVIKNIFSGGAMILTTMDGDDLPHPANADIAKDTTHKRPSRLTHLGKKRASR